MAMGEVFFPETLADKDNFIRVFVINHSWMVDSQSYQKPCSLDFKTEAKMVVIKVLGPGCSNCKKVEAVARQAVSMLGVEADFVKVTDWNDIKKYPILSTPGLVINEKLVCGGRIPNAAEVTTWLADALS